jgi:hypothetical protein
MSRFKRLPAEEKVRELEKLAKAYRRSYPDSRVKKWQEIVVDAIRFRDSGIPESHLNYIFGQAVSEEELWPQVSHYFKTEIDDRYETHYCSEHIRIGASEPDVILFLEHEKRRPAGKRHWWSRTRPRRTTRTVREVIAVEAKVDFNQMRRFESQVNDYQKAADKVYLATTEWLVIAKGRRELEQYLRRNGVGLIHVDMSNKREDRCKIVVKSRKRRAFDTLERKKLIEILSRT